MKGFTHASVGTNAAWLALLAAATAANPVPAIIAAAIGALLPDIDTSQSKIRRLRFGNITPFGSLGQAVNISQDHRGVTHSLVGLGVMALISAIGLVWFHPIVWLAAILGYSSHLLLDSITPAGIPLAWPNPQRYHLLPAGKRIGTGGVFDTILGYLGLFGVATFLLIVLSNQSSFSF